MNYNYNKSTRPGYSLIEIIVAMSIFMVLIFIANDYITSGFKASRFESEQHTAVQEARKAMETVEITVRMAADAANGAYIIEKALSDELDIYSDVIQAVDNYTEKIKFINNSATNELLQVTTMYNPGSGQYDSLSATTTVARYTNNQSEPFFSYYDNAGATTTQISDIRRVKFIIKINVTPSVAPNDYYVETDITLRNIKDNL